MGTLTTSLLNTVQSYRGSTTLSGTDVMEVSLSGTTGYVSAKCTLDQIKTYCTPTLPNTTYKVFDIFYRTVSTTPNLITYANAAYSTNLTLYSAWPLFIDDSAQVSDSFINKTAPNWIGKYSSVSPANNVKSIYTTFWNNLSATTLDFTSSTNIKWDSVNINSASSITNSLYMQEYNANGYTGRFLIDIVNGLVAAPILNNTFVRTTSGGTSLGTSETDTFKSHLHEVLNYNTAGAIPGTFFYGDYGAGTQQNINYTVLSGSNETRPKNVRYCPYMQIADSVTQPSIVDINNALSGYVISPASNAEVATTFTTPYSGINTKVVTPSSLGGGFTYTGNQSLSSNGYQTLPGGLIMQWGITPNINALQQIQDVVFHKLFPNTCYNVQLTPVYDGVESGAMSVYLSKTAGHLLSNTGFGVQWDSDGVTFNNMQCNWFAIGY